MPTQEERLTALEQSQIKFGEAISDLNHYVTMVLGVVQKQEWEMREMRGSLRSLDSNVQTLEHNVQTLQQNVQTIERNVQTLERNMNTRFEEQDKKLDSILHILNTLTGKSD
ncbi:MAG TPA: hypothetical protein VFQ30_09560 [Ktedonobacteraceae bacterium]|nr:hypothetical protein [Ktedonobacteraceae bacterium]